MRTILTCLFLCLNLFAPLSQAGPQQTPTIEYTSMLDSFELYHQSRRLGFGEIYGAFFPEEAIDRGQADGPVQKTFLVIRDSAGAELYRNPLYVSVRHTVWVNVRPGGTPVNYTFETPGDYSYAIELNGKDIAKVPFTFTIKDTGDPFNPSRMGFVKGPWSDVACLSLPMKGATDKSPKFIYWDRGGAFAAGKQANVRLEIHQDGDTVFVSRPAIVPGVASSSHWYSVKLDISFPKADGGGPIKLKDLLKKDGTYKAMIFRDEEPWKLFEFQVASGALVPHARSAFGYQPHFDHLISRDPASQEPKSENLVWMEVQDADALAAAGAGPAQVGAASPSDLASWTVKLSSPADRSAALKLTGAAVRMDAGIAAGDDVIAFATGSIKGISWMRVGEDTEHSLPGGQDFHSKHFFVCGKKIVMLRGAQVVVFDTDTETLHEIPLGQVSLAKSFLDNYKGNPIAADGFLVATLNDPKKVDDRVIVKVIDVSGATPRVIALKNTELPVSQIESIAVDAETGKVAFGSNRDSALYIADVAERAVFERLDLSSIDGYGRGTTPMLAGGWLAYFDASGSQPKIRLIELATKRTQTLVSLGKAYRCYDMTANRLAFATSQGRGSDYAFAVGAPGTGAKTPEGAGTNLGTTGAKIGLGGSVAIAGELTFIAGLGKSGVGSTEFLQVTDGTIWKAVVGPDGKPLPAVDVVATDRLVTFKTGKRNDTQVGYITLGKNTKLADIPTL